MRRSLLSVAVGLLAACGREAAPPPAPEPYVLTTFYPLTYFAQRIAGDAVEIACPLPAGADPVSWRPSRDALAAFQGARLILVNGAEFERWLPTASLPASRVVDTAAAFRDRFLRVPTTTHTHGSGGAHTHEGLDGHTWLDPRNAMQQASAIAAALSRTFPEHGAKFAAGLAALQADLEDLDRRLAALGQTMTGVRLLASHRAYDYLAARYGWQVTNLALEPEAALGDEQRAEIERARGGAARCVLLWEGEPLPATAAALRALEVRSVLFSPAENVPPADLAAGQDYLAIMRANVERLRAALQP